MPAHPNYPTPDEDEEVPTPERIIDRIINGRLRRFASTPSDPA